MINHGIGIQFRVLALKISAYNWLTEISKEMVKNHYRIVFAMYIVKQVNCLIFYLS
jgi:hypothetical protein